jgi:deoxycytidylate deaminase
MRQYMTTEAKLADPFYLTCPSVHGEINAIAYADRSRMEDGVMYVSSVPCIGCAKIISNSGIVLVVWRSVPELDARRDVPGVRDYFRKACVATVVA